MNIEETNGYKIAIAFKPFIDPKCTEHMEIVKDMAKSINSGFKNIDNYIKKLETQLAFERGERVVFNGVTYQKGINEHSFQSAMDS
jgi:hypothetical protein